MPVDPDERLALAEHLDELRKRLFWAIAALCAGVAVAAVFNDLVFDLLLRPLEQVSGLPASACQITTFGPAEPLTVSLKIWIVAGALLVSPFLIWQLWAFVGPAFTSAQKRYFYPVFVATTGLFVGGVVFGYVVVLPRGLQFLLAFGGEHFNVQQRAGDYFTFVALFVLAFGLVFEVPVVLVLLARVGVIDHRFLRKKRRWAVLINAVVAAVITPSQDAFSMLAMLVPLLVLYEVSIPLARLVEPRAEPDRCEAVRGDDTPDDLGSAPA